MLLSPVPRLSKLHRVPTCEERGTQDWEPKSTRLINKDLSDLWKFPTPEGNGISGSFKREDLLAPSVA